MSESQLTPGSHTFKATTGNILSYHVTPSEKPNAPLWVHQSTAWGPGRTQYVKGLAPLLSKHFTVLNFSPRANDESSRPKDENGNDDPSQMTCTLCAHDLESLRTYLGLSSFYALSGHSNGGCTCLLYAALYPERVQNLFPIAAQILGVPLCPHVNYYRALRADNEACNVAFATLAASNVERANAEHMKSFTEEQFTATLIQVVPPYLVDSDRYTEIVQKSLEGSRSRIWNFNAITPSYKTEENAASMIPTLLGKIQARVLMLNGRYDWICDVAFGEQATEKMREGAAKESRIEVFEKSGHYPYVEEEEKFMKVLLEFLKANAAASG